MGVFQIETADGKVFEIEAADAQTASRVFQQASGQPAGMDAPAPPAPPGRTGGPLETVDAAMRGVADTLTFGLADEATAGVQAALAGGHRSPVTGRPAADGEAGSLGERYDRKLAEQRAVDAYDSEQHPVARIGGQVAGGLLGASGLAKAGLTTAGRAAGASLPAQMGLGALEGAAYGGAYGFGSGEGGIGGRLAGAATGAVVGGATGGVVPAFAAGVRTVAQPVLSAVQARLNPAGYAAQKVISRLESDNLTAAQAGGKIARAGQNGDNLSLADVGGENTKALLRTASNVPGTARQRIQTTARMQAMRQGERIKGALNEGLQAPEGAYEATKQAIIEARSKAASPYYKLAYAQPIPYTRNLEGVLNTPAAKAALATAKANSLNRREPWAQWFASIDDAGNIIDKRRVPDTRALDETQRVLRGMVEAAKKTPDGSPFAKPRDTPQSIAIRSVLTDLMKEMDTANPAFRKARAVALDNISADEAIEFGRDALKTDSRIIERRMSGQGPDALTEGQKQIARAGLADAVRAKIDDAGFTHNALLRFFSTREQVARLRPFFDTEQQWKQFRTSMFNEARKRSTYNAVTGNSTTARQLADMQEAGALEGMAQTGVDAVMRGPASAAITATIRGVTSAARRLGGLTPETADYMARYLLSRDPKVVNTLMLKLKSIEASQAAGAVKAAQVRQLLADAGAIEATRALSSPRPLEITVTRPANWAAANPQR